MTRIKKLLNRFITSPMNVSCRELHKILVFLGFMVVRTNGSHRIYENDVGIQIVIPIHGNDCKKVYKKSAQKIIMKLYEKK